VEVPAQAPSPAHSKRQAAAKLFVILLVPSAIAVAGVLLLLRLYFQPPTVPRYALADAGPEELEIDVLRGARFEVELRPVAPVVGAVAARAFLLRGNEVRPWPAGPAHFDVERDGSVRIAGAVDTLFAKVPSGPWEIAIAVGRPETLPIAPAEILRAHDAGADAGPAPWQLVCERIKLGG
jgi:hypothetical protein